MVIPIRGVSLGSLTITSVLGPFCQLCLYHLGILLSRKSMVIVASAYDDILALRRVRHIEIFCAPNLALCQCEVCCQLAATLLEFAGRIRLT